MWSLYYMRRKVERERVHDLALRNNRTSAEHPLGIYHPHADKHHIKKENIGLIEVMGLAILPARLKAELELLAEYLLTGKDIAGCEMIAKHTEWAKKIIACHFDIRESTINDILNLLKKEVGHVFVRVLEDAGVYQCTEAGQKAFLRFIDSL